MTKERKILILASIIVLVAILLGISRWMTARQDAAKLKAIAETEQARIETKTKMYPRAPEIIGYPPGGVLGKKVILVNFWTSASSNSLRVIPHLNAWYDKYKDSGLQIIGVHTPQFDFEKDAARLASTTDALGINYPIVQDNDHTTWTNFKNSNWPRIYIIDLDGFIVYDHIGEGGYENIEKMIQRLINDNSKPEISNSETIEFPGTPSYYFGSQRNELLGNGKVYQRGTQTLKKPKEVALNKIYLTGKWDVEDQYAKNMDAKAKIIFNYVAKEVYLVAGSDQPNKLTILQDGKPYISTTTPLRGSYAGQATSTIESENLHLLVQNPDASEHTLEITINKSGLMAYVVEFR